jgi:hypothetical protein
MFIRARPAFNGAESGDLAGDAHRLDLHRPISMPASVIPATLSRRLSYSTCASKEVCMPAIGDLAPDFTLRDDQGREVTLSALRGKTIVLWFYPKDDTPG